ncbi:hypothetical protein ACPPVW_15230 [Leifsonia sp. McL0607]|uniref:hypothetical protein n=1 Tax=Leifsonia sp. McL0607 TaxID=3415672 RepID=UPI003CF88BB6
MSRIEAGIVSYTLLSDYYAQVGADFDTEAVDDAILAELNRMLPSGILVERSGKVLADEGSRVSWTGPPSCRRSTWIRSSPITRAEPTS